MYAKKDNVKERTEELNSKREYEQCAKKIMRKTNLLFELQTFA